MTCERERESESSRACVRTESARAFTSASVTSKQRQEVENTPATLQDGGMILFTVLSLQTVVVVFFFFFTFQVNFLYCSSHVVCYEVNKNLLHFSPWDTTRWFKMAKHQSLQTSFLTSLFWLYTAFQNYSEKLVLIFFFNWIIFHYKWYWVFFKYLTFKYFLYWFVPLL